MTQTAAAIAAPTQPPQTRNATRGSPPPDRAARSQRSSAGRGSGPPRRSPDLLDALGETHRRLDHRCRELRRAPRTERQRDLERFAVDLLAHEALEELLLYPLVATRLSNGSLLASERLREGAQLDVTLEGVQATRSDDQGAAVDQFHQDLTEHTYREEVEVFPLARYAARHREFDGLGVLYAAVHRRLSESPTLAGLRRHPSTDGDPRPRLLRFRDAAVAELAELGFELPPGVGTGDDELTSPLHDLAPANADAST